MNPNEAKKIVVLGMGGHASVIIDALMAGGASVAGVVGPNNDVGQHCQGVAYLGSDDYVDQVGPQHIDLAMGLGILPGMRKRRKILTSRHEANGFKYVSVVHPSAILSNSVNIARGAQIMAGAVLQAYAEVGAHSIINTRVSVDHHCKIAAHCHLAPGVVLGGGVELGEGSFVGIGSTVFHGVRIGKNCIIAGGSLVRNDLPDNSKYLEGDITSCESVD